MRITKYNNFRIIMDYYDKQVAKKLQDQLNCTGLTENAVFPLDANLQGYKPRTLVDETLEIIDPTPNIFTLFVQFNEKFFWNVLLPVQVKWSPRMTSCAGICTFHPRNRECVISLSLPLLKLRPRKDLVQTLLHEMIHAYLFLTNNNRDRDGHGPEFCKHMNRINQTAGTKITIYHTFHDEVKLYQTHWWRCDGPCQHRKPFFGLVKRAMNRAPGPNDLWWAEHQQTCGGKFVKIREPEKPEKSRKSNTNKSTSIDKFTNKSISGAKSTNNATITSWLNKSDTKNKTETQTDLKKLGNTTNNVHGWGVGGPSGSSDNSFNKKFDTPAAQTSTSKNSTLSFTGTLGGKNTGKSKLLDLYANSTPKSSPDPKTKASGSSQLQSGHNNVSVNTKVPCPNCSKIVDLERINSHLDICLSTSEEPQIDLTKDNKRKKTQDSIIPKKLFKPSLDCPACDKTFGPEEFNDHLDECLLKDLDDSYEKPEEKKPTRKSSVINLHDSKHKCLICGEVLKEDMTLEEHLEICINTVFDDCNDDDNNMLNDQNKKTTEKFPCPVCFKNFEEAEMFEHVDSCLQK